MNFIYYNPNPKGNHIRDCVIRALTIALDCNWQSAFLQLMLFAYNMKDMPSSNAVWGSLLRSRGYKQYVLPSDCPYCYTVRNFCIDNPRGLYVLATGTHVVSIIDGKYYDSWDSGDQIVTYYFMLDR